MYDRFSRTKTVPKKIKRDSTEQERRPEAHERATGRTLCSRFTETNLSVILTATKMC